ncbi:MAG: cell surface protein [Burkholderiaceae bacterium]|nr:cell surface protein [Burkholderiaceae bacterium]
MRKNILALSIAAMVGSLGLVGAASAAVITTSTVVANPTADAFVVSPNGIGHVLLVPYYTVQNGNNTLLSIVNTDTLNGKVVKVRFRGASNSDDVFDFQIFMSPGDIWNANVHINSEGKAELFTADKSCTLPTSVNQGFVTDRLPSTYSVTDKNKQTLEGYIEILNTADVPKAKFAAQANLTGTDNPLYTAIKHVNGVAPCTQAILDLTAVDPTTHSAVVDLATNAAYQGMTFPTTGLLANWTIINVPGATTWTGEATAVVAATTATTTAAAGNLVFHPQTNDPVADPEVRTADPLLAAGNTVVNNLGVATGAAVTGAANTPATVGIVPASMFDFPDLSTPYVVRPAVAATAPKVQAAALTGSLAVSEVKNEYLTNPGITAETDWVFSSPTRRYTVAVDYSTAPFRRVFSAYGAAASQYFYDLNTLFDAASGQVCVLNVTPKPYDAEERTPTAGVGFVISPGGQAAPLTFCGEVSVLSFNNAAGTSVLGAALARKDIDVTYTDGWLSIATPGNAGIGLPILGASFEKAFNTSVSPGIAGNYGLTFGHRFTRPAGFLF